MNTPASAPVKELRRGLWQVKVPLPFPLRWVNSYVLQGSAGGVTILDPGLRTEAAEELWTTVLPQLGIPYDRIGQVVLTHHHPDHYGMAGWLQERTDAPVYLSETGIEQAALLWGPGQPMTRLLTDLFAQHGMDAALCEQLTKHMDSFVPLVSPQPSMTALRPGDRVRLGDAEYEAIETPGHAAGHLCFYDAGAEEIFCGDHVLPRITPNISFMPGVEADPLGAYLSSLEEIGKLKVRMAYPGHRDPFAGFSERALELIRHHEERLASMTEKLRGQPMTAYELCRATFGDRLSLHQLRFAMAETIAHTVRLELGGRVRAGEAGGMTVYSA
ncbi:MBL fold metallo-hydrolase [Paenibacillus lutrae]|uniref:MBL fold metallo-hydrolase n=1 Tax=Paenibacillus lutrae TaxID=2078573 RepID=A0A7X3FIV9_9BACL|nr:MBL fold metallo-hydrolase [Paenibacillus lutrae]MVP00538.1 MBL fold metallo-hydrolase [Paenibacillus lutrae]